MSVHTLLAACLGIGTATGLAMLIWGGRTPTTDVPQWMERLSGQVTRRRIGAVAAGFVAALGTGWAAAGVLTSAAVLVLPRLLGGNREHHVVVDRLQGIAGWVEMLRDTLSAAAGIEQAIHATADLAPAAIREDVTTLSRRIDSGMPLPDALRAMADEIADPTADAVLAALIVACEQHGRIAEVLTELAADAREQVAARARIEAGRARVHTSVRVIVTTTTAFTLGLVVFNRPYLAPYDTATGQVVLAAIGVCFAAAIAWMSRIAAIIPHPRLLPATEPAPAREGSSA